MMRLLAAGMLLFATNAFGHALWWVKPVAYEDGTLIGLNEAVSSVVEWSDTMPFGAVDGVRAVATASSVTMPDPTAPRCYRVRAVVAGEQSAPSLEWCRGPLGPIVAQPLKVPSAPTGLGGN